MLNEQQGNIIAMIRQAANDNGEGFLESVDPACLWRWRLMAFSAFANRLPDPNYGE